MRKATIRRTWAFVLAMVCILGCFAAKSAYAETKSVTVPGNLYEFGEKSHYDYTAAEPTSEITTDNAMGSFALFGDVTADGEYNGVPSYVVSTEDAELKYVYSEELLTASEDEWHLVEDKTKKAAGFKLKSDIKKGALILQTSKDGQSWIEDLSQTNVFKEMPKDPGELEPFYKTKSVQLANGCYYRLIVAYELQRKTGENKGLLGKTEEYEDKKIAEVYEFYLHDSNIAANDNALSKNLGEFTKTEKDKGYSGTDEIDINDPHYGWEIGQFFVSGYTRETVDEKNPKQTVFLKNAGDKVTLWFNLKEDINKLHGNDKLSIADDKDGYDQYFQTEKTDMGRGTLIIRYTDEKGVKHEPEIYTNYLEANTTTGADTVVQMFEEGDYEVALDYRIKNTPHKVGVIAVVPKYTDYRISFTFKIRNGNCMVYPFDIATGSELTDKSITENGFKLDMAKSRYLTIDVKRAAVTEGANGYVEDIRFNRPAKDGEEYTDEGIYTFNVKNLYTGENTTKTIYVGSTDYMRALSVNELTVSKLNAEVENGASIAENGMIISPTFASDATPESELTGANKSDSAEQNVNEASVVEGSKEDGEDDSSDSGPGGSPVIPIAVGGATAIALFTVVLSRKKYR